MLSLQATRREGSEQVFAGFAKGPAKGPAGRESWESKLVTRQTVDRMFQQKAGKFFSSLNPPNEKHG